MDTLDRNSKLITRFTAEVDPAEAEVALSMLASLKVRADDWKPSSAYDRKKLPLRWARIARLGMDVKDMTQDLDVDPEGKIYDSDGYTLRYAMLHDPYTGEDIEFRQVKDVKDRQIDLDHVVALSDAFISGGHRWKRDGYTWMNLANDPGNLLAVARTSNLAKSDSSAASWLPDNPRRDFRGRYVIMQVQIKTRYRLSVTESELTAMRRVLEGI